MFDPYTFLYKALDHCPSTMPNIFSILFSWIFDNQQLSVCEQEILQQEQNHQTIF